MASMETALFGWNAPARPFKRRNRQFWVTIIAIAAMAGLVLFFAEGYMPVILIIALIFLFYVMNTVEPEEIKHEITNKGIKTGGKITGWEVLSRFWFSRRFDSTLLIFEMKVLPGRMEMVVSEADKEKIRKAISAYLPEEEVPASQLDKLANWFSAKLPQG